jgi:hypothetical protein
MERDNKPEITSLMRPALREAYQAAVKIFEENEYTPVKKIKYFPDGNVATVEFRGLTREMARQASDAGWKVMLAMKEKGITHNDNLGMCYLVPPSNSLSNGGFLSIS